MRISDWSSDVCSSDLRLLVELDVARPPLGREEIGLGPQGCRLAGVGGALVLEHGQLLAQELVEPCRRLGHGIARGGRALRRCLLPDRRLLGGSILRRSEEHPSELQSTMRIPYAV